MSQVVDQLSNFRRIGRHPRRRLLLIGAAVAGLMLAAAATAYACIPWAGSLHVEAINNQSETTTYGADHTDVAKDGTQNADRGNNQGMVWCSTDDPNVDQPYKWVEIEMDGGTGDDVTLTVGDNDDAVAGGGSGCASDVYLPEDRYHITFRNSVFDNEDESTANSTPTYSDDRPSSTGTNGPDELYPTSDHCMDIDNDEEDGTNDNQIIWENDELIEDDDGNAVASVNDGPTGTVDDERFPADDVDVIDEGPHSMSIDLDNDFNPAPDETKSDVNNRDPGTTGVEAGCIGITSEDEFHHDNTGSDSDNDDEVAGGDKDTVMIEYGNVVPVNFTTM